MRFSKVILFIIKNFFIKAGLSDFQRDFVDNSSAAAVLKEKEMLQQGKLFSALSAGAPILSASNCLSLFSRL